jgi:hypothetical protein
MGKMNIKTSEIIQALVAYAGPFDDPRVGWTGSNASRHDIFKCERCGAEHFDCAKIEHKDGCSAKALIDILAKLRPNVQIEA